LTGLTSLQFLNLTGCEKLSQKPPKPDHPQPLASIAPEEDRQRQEVVGRLCRTLEKENWHVVRDKTALRYGDLISPFMKTLGQPDLVIVVLSAKYLQSPYCMTELHALFRTSPNTGMSRSKSCYCN
jgi:hypothetical protein